MSVDALEKFKIGYYISSFDFHKEFRQNLRSNFFLAVIWLFSRLDKNSILFQIVFTIVSKKFTLAKLKL